MRVLVAQDRTVVADLVKRVLEAEGYEIDVARDGEAALALGTQRRYGAIMLDLRHQDVDIVHVAKQLRLEGVKSPILVMAEAQAAEKRMRDAHLFAVKSLPRPFKFSNLVAHLEQIARSLRQWPRGLTSDR